MTWCFFRFSQCLWALFCPAHPITTRTCTPCLKNCKPEEIINLELYNKISPVQEPSLFCFLFQSLLHLCSILEFRGRCTWHHKDRLFLFFLVQASFNSKDAGRASNQRLTHWGPQTFALQRLTIVQTPMFMYSSTIQKPHFKYLHSVYIFKYRKGNTSGLRSRCLMRFQKASMIRVLRNKKK